jgi:hypothetical protein
MRQIIFALIFVLFAICYDGFTQSSIFKPMTMSQTLPVPVFTDGFETETNWMLFEEIVGGNTCYGSGIGSVARSMDVAYEGSYSLSVWANQTRSTKSNHLIGYKKYSDLGQMGILRYEIHSYIAPTTANSGETGPEFSMQNTRQIAPGEFRTSTAGIQYVANSSSSEADNWKVWREVTPGVAGWHTFMNQPLQAGVWYTLTVEADYNNNYYQSFSIQGGGLNLSTDLSTYRIAEEGKFNEQAFVITLESENRWNNCGTAGVYDYQVYYDQVTLTQQLAKVYLPVILK